MAALREPGVRSPYDYAMVAKVSRARASVSIHARPRVFRIGTLPPRGAARRAAAATGCI